eukprot:TRINITY_DN13160_c0_g1_i1.p1 TRINITY_DN13160_c0_g1~~TRINITY_DN13160_c0_g1_i1.p1  ORF type:complete len:132 (-),score=4.71 TRINITY_DN13160_c0_g1_i1:104-499(-)
MQTPTQVETPPTPAHTSHGKAKVQKYTQGRSPPPSEALVGIYRAASSCPERPRASILSHKIQHTMPKFENGRMLVRMVLDGRDQIFPGQGDANRILELIHLTSEAQQILLSYYTKQQFVLLKSSGSSDPCN